MRQLHKATCLDSVRSGKEDSVSAHLCETIYAMPGLNIEACPLKTGMISTLQLLKRHLTLNWKWISEDLLQCTFINLNDNTYSYLFLLCLHSYVNECAFGWYVEHDKILYYTFLSDGLHFAQFSISCLKQHLKRTEKVSFLFLFFWQGK